jgi:hypothetical protein
VLGAGAPSLPGVTLNQKKAKKKFSNEKEEVVVLL